MIRSIVGLLFCGMLTTFSYAQIGQGGIPLSMKAGVVNNIGAPETVTLHNEQFQNLLHQADAGSLPASSGAYQVGWSVPADLDLVHNGTWSYLADGTRLWRLNINVPGAKALAVYYNQFYLPKGVSLYLTNDNQKQVLGAYTSDNNAANGVFSNQPLLGEVACLELNIPSYVRIEDIKLGIYFVGAYYRGVDVDLKPFASEVNPLANPISGPPFNVSAECHKEAMCPNGDPAAKSRTSTARIIIANAPNTGVGYCSGSLINNTGNVEGGTCKPLFLTASHCDEDNGHDDNHFQYWQFRLNFQKSDCGSANTVYPTPATSPTMTEGAKFRARSNYPTFSSGSTGSSSLVQDFLLLELNDVVPSDYYLAGWNRNSNIASPSESDYYTVFYGFHHPGGDLKKMSSTSTIAGNGTFNQSTVPATHWGIQNTFGGTAGGSSGSGLFDVDGYLIGDLSGGPDAVCVTDAKDFGTSALYSKLSYGWNNDFDQTEFPAYAGAASQLKAHLDPLNSGVAKLPPAKATTCDEMVPVGISDHAGTLDEQAIHIYPSPSTDGNINVQFNLKSAVDVTLRLYNVMGAEVGTYFIPNVSAGTRTLNLSNDLANGVYIVNVQTAIGQSNYKIVLNR